jgi:hypothetical protein
VDEIIQLWAAGLNVCFLQKMKWKTKRTLLSRFNSKSPSPSCLFALLFPHNKHPNAIKKIPLFTVCFFYSASLAFFFFGLSLLCFLLSFCYLFCVFFHPLLLFFCSPFCPPIARSLEGFIYSLEYLYLGKI